MYHRFGKPPFVNPDKSQENPGGGTRPKIVLAKLGLLTPKLAILYRISVESGQFGGPWILKIFNPPLIFGDLTPPIPASKSEGATQKVFVHVQVTSGLVRVIATCGEICSPCRPRCACDSGLCWLLHCSPLSLSLELHRSTGASKTIGPRPQKPLHTFIKSSGELPLVAK